MRSTFPHASYRPGQAEAIDEALAAFRSGKKVVIIEGPTGTGKTAIGITIAREMGRAYYLTSTKMLQEQLSKEFLPPELETLKGRNAYECNFWEKYPTEVKKKKKEAKTSCAEGHCKRMDKSSHTQCTQMIEGRPTCPYFDRMHYAVDAPIAAMNYHNFVYHLSNPQSLFETRPLLIGDEAHNIESIVMSLVSVTISETNLRADGISVPKLDNVSEYQAWIKTKGLLAIGEAKARDAKAHDRLHEMQEWEDFVERLKRLSEANPSQWVAEWSEKVAGKVRFAKVVMKPLYAREFTTRFYFSRANKILLMSATIVSFDQMCASLGIKPEEAHFIRIPSHFPPENRPILFIPVGSMSHKKKHETIPAIGQKIAEIARAHEGQRGIIHTHSFWVAEQIFNRAPEDVRSRMLYQSEWFSKDEMLRKHSNSTDSIIIGPAWHEGLDLKDDLARFAIICKVPYPNFVEDAQIKRRMEIDPEYYDYLTALKLIQSYGRTVRHDQDWSITYILDADFERFARKAGHLLPLWMAEAIQ